MSDIRTALAALDFDKKETWIKEAEFGFNYISNIVHESKAKNVLEVGCGSGLLLSMLAHTHPEIQFRGIEPFGDGFSSLQELNKHIQTQGIKIENIGYEEYTPTHKYDLIYLVNVFEHLNDWQHFLMTIQKWLNKNGKCIILCPNYGFPYESHFALPIFFSKNLTFKIFQNKIETYEKVNKCSGLWKSLNFVQKNKVMQFAQSHALEIQDLPDVLDDIIKRLETDEEFKKRQNTIGKVAYFVSRIGLSKLFHLPFFRRFSPYMYLVITPR